MLSILDIVLCRLLNSSEQFPASEFVIVGTWYTNI